MSNKTGRSLRGLATIIGLLAVLLLAWLFWALYGPSNADAPLAPSKEVTRVSATTVATSQPIAPNQPSPSVTAVLQSTGTPLPPPPPLPTTTPPVTDEPRTETPPRGGTPRPTSTPLARLPQPPNVGAVVRTDYDNYVDPETRIAVPIPAGWSIAVTGPELLVLVNDAGARVRLFLRTPQLPDPVDYDDVAFYALGAPIFKVMLDEQVVFTSNRRFPSPQERTAVASITANDPSALAVATAAAEQMVQSFWHAYSYAALPFEGEYDLPVDVPIWSQYEAVSAENEDDGTVWRFRSYAFEPAYVPSAANDALAFNWVPSNRRDCGYLAVQRSGLVSAFGCLDDEQAVGAEQLPATDLATLTDLLARYQSSGDRLNGGWLNFAGTGSERLPANELERLRRLADSLYYRLAIRPKFDDATPIEPLLTVRDLRVGDWSPDSQWVPLWLTDDELANQGSGYNGALAPPAKLHFLHVPSGELCAMDNFVRDWGGNTIDPGIVTWLEDGRVAVGIATLTKEGTNVTDIAYEWQAGMPCQPTTFAPTAPQPLPEYHQSIEQEQASPDGQLIARTVIVDAANDEPLVRTTLVDALTGVALVSAEWVGMSNVHGCCFAEWLTPTQYLIIEQYQDEPLILDAKNGTVQRFFSDVARIETPSPAAAEQYHVAAVSDPLTNDYVIYFMPTDGENSFLYHSALDTVETLPPWYWWHISADFATLYLHQASFGAVAFDSLGEAQGPDVYLRRIDAIGEPFEQLGSALGRHLWTDDDSEFIATQHKEYAVWYAGQSGRRLGIWQTEQPVWPRSLSPDGRYAVLQGNLPADSYAERATTLYLLPRPDVPAPLDVPEALISASPNSYYTTTVDTEPLWLDGNRSRFSPDGSRLAGLAVLLEDGVTQTIVVRDMVDGSDRRIDLNGYTPAWSTHIQWLDNTTVVLGLFDEQADEGPNSGHLALVNVECGDTVCGAEAITFIDDQYLMTSPPAVNAGRIVYATTERRAKIRQWHNGSVTEIDTAPLVALSASDEWFWASSVSADGNLQTWWVKTDNGLGLTAYDVGSGTAEIIFDMLSPSIAARIRPAIANGAGDWLAVQSIAQAADQAGLWLVAIDGSQAIRLRERVSRPVWLNDTQLAFVDTTDPDLPVLVYDLLLNTYSYLTLPDGVAPVSMRALEE